MENANGTGLPLSPFETFLHPSLRVWVDAQESLLWKSAATIGTFFVLRFFINVVYQLFFSPLASIPGPKIAAVTSWWLEWEGLRFRRVLSLHGAFQKYGPIVRVGPKAVILSDIEDLREVYRGHKYRKSSWYDFFVFDNVPNIFATTDPAFHARVSKWAAPAFRRDNLRAGQPALQEVLYYLCERIRRESDGGKPVDVLRLMRLLSLDMLGVMVLGQRFDQMKTSVDHPFVRYLDCWLIDKAMLNYLPRPLYSLLKLYPWDPLKTIFEADPAFASYGRDIYDNIDTKGSTEDNRKDILSNCKNYVDPETGESPPRDLVIGQGTLFFGAGTDTTAIGLCYLIWEAARNPKIYEEVHAELMRAVPEADPRELPDVDVLRELPYMNALIKDSLRIWGSASSMFERVVPSGGTTFQGRFLPSGTIVGGQAYTSHRRPDLFPDADKIIPERWLKRNAQTGEWQPKTPEELGEMHTAYTPFGQGARACMGRPVAEIEIIMTISALFRNFKVKPDASATPESMKPMDLGLMKPQSGKCLILFESVE